MSKGPASRLHQCSVYTTQGIWKLDAENRTELVNAIGASVLGYSPEEVVGRPVEDFVSPGCRDEIDRLTRGGPGTEREGRLRFCHKDGREIWASLRVSILSEEGRHGKVVVFSDITEQCRLEDALRESREDLALAQSVSHTGSWRLRVQTGELLWSDETYRLFNIPIGTPMTYERFLERVHPDDQEMLNEKWNAALRGAPYDVEHRIVVDGAVKWVREKAVLEFQGPELLGAFGTVQNISDIKQAQLVMEEERSRLRTILDTLPVGVIISDVRGTMVEMNDALRRVWGMGAPMLSAVSEYKEYRGWRPETGERYKAEDWALGRALRGEVVVGETVDIERFDGKRATILSSAAPIRGPRGSIIGAVVTAQDITDRVTAEYALRESEEKFAKAFHGVTVAMALSRMDDGRFIDVNERWLRLHGLCREEVIGHTSRELDIWVVPEQRQDMTKELEANGFFHDREFEFRRKGWEVWTALMSAQVITLRGEKAILVSLLDITDRKRMEEELRRSNAELQQFAYVASHDLQEPLRMVTAYMSILERKLGDKLDDEARAYMEFATDGALRMRELIRDLLTYTILEPGVGHLGPVDMNAAASLAEKNLDELISSNRARIEVGKLPIVYADGTQMMQLFQNLIGNAVKYHGERPPEVSVYCSESPKEWTFCVRDNGIGMAPEYHYKIFQMFQRLHARDEYPGTGVGLAIAKKIVERHGGHIWVESEEGKGSTFCFTISKMLRFGQERSTNC